MTTNTIRQRISTIITAIIMGAFGLTSFASADSITNTGPNSTNTITTTEVKKCEVTNNNTVNVTETNNQTATTGNAVVTNNTTAGSAETGNAVNENTAEFIVNISNDSAFIGPDADDAPAPVIPVEPLLDECGNPIPPSVCSSNCGGISNTGPGSTNRINNRSNFVGRLNNNNRVGLRFGNFQGARSGSAFVSRNTSGGGGGSGAAQNTNAPAASVVVANVPAGGSGGGGSTPHPAVAPSSSISNTGPNSSNTISSTTSSNTTVNNNNNVSYSGTNNQTADSGNATVTYNTTAGSGGTGSAANSNDTSGAVGIAN